MNNHECLEICINSIQPPNLPCEWTSALSKMKADKSPGDDGVSVELLKAGRTPVVNSNSNTRAIEECHCYHHAQKS